MEKNHMLLSSPKTVPNLIRRFFHTIDPKPALKRYRRKKAMKLFYGEFIKQGDLCFDIGANRGNRTEIFLSLGARVVALEPQPDCVESLKRAYSRNPFVTIVPLAVGETEGKQEMFVSDADTISTMSSDWIAGVKESGRFKEFSWEKKIAVGVTTLDALIKQYGDPAFIKVDVEGFEEKVVTGLSQKVQAMSLEFTPECYDATVKCVRHLSRIGTCEFNISFGETMKFAHQNWLPSLEMIEKLEEYGNRYELNGDVYLRFV
jgi:FkbM family methyltransferase